MDNKKKYTIGAAVVIGLSPAIVAIYFNASMRYIGLPGCEMVASNEQCMKRNNYIHIPKYLVVQSSRALLCLLGTLTGKWGQILEGTMCRHSHW